MKQGAVRQVVRETEVEEPPAAATVEITKKEDPAQGAPIPRAQKTA
jgi:hypothetical protein